LIERPVLLQTHPGASRSQHPLAGNACPFRLIAKSNRANSA
jgi:hypothetical protein